MKTVAIGQKVSTKRKDSEQLQYREWGHKISVSQTGETYKKLECQLHEVCAGELVDKLQSEWSIISNHVNIKKIQSAEFECDKQCDKTRILQIDFAMNYSCEYQNEVQSALWSRNSVLLFTAATIFSGVCKTFLICSDSKWKNKDSIAPFLFYLYENHIAPDDDVETEVIWSDGPSSEFKNRYMVHLMKELSKKVGTPFAWKYFVTSHGKGIVDGIGGRAKALVRQKVMSKGKDRIIVQSAEEFAQAARILMGKTSVIFIPQTELDHFKAERNLFQNVPGIENITQIHVAKVGLNEKLSFAKHALEQETAEVSSVSFIDPIQPSSYKVGDWVRVLYDGDNQTYPGEITEVHNENLRVNVMERAGGNSKWPRREDNIYYSLENIVKLLQPPVVVGSRGQFQFNDI